MEFKLPELGEGVHEGELVKWKVKKGETVGFDQPLCEIMTDKATVEIPSAIQGKVTEIHAKEGEVVKVGQLMLSFEGSQKGSSSSLASTPQPAPASSGHSPVAAKPAAQTALTTQARPQAAVAPIAQSSERVAASPSTRKLARELGVDLVQVRGSGDHGRVLREDVEAFSRGGTSARREGSSLLKRGPEKSGEERVAFRGLRKKISEKMRQSKDHAAHFTYVEEADVSDLVKLRAAAKSIGEGVGVKVTYLPFVMKAMVMALKKYPILNSSLDEEKGEIVYKYFYNIVLSVQTEDGLTAPVIKDVGNKSILEIAKDIQEVVERARTKKLTMDDLTGGTITLTNAGTIGGLFATPIINYPEVAILGFNKIFRKPVAKMIQGREEIVVADWTYFSISLDHRIVDGAIAAEFTKEFIRIIETPSLLLMEAL